MVRHFAYGSWVGGWKGPQRLPQKRLDRQLEEVAKAVGGGYCWLQMPLKRALAVRLCFLIFFNFRVVWMRGATGIRWGVSPAAQMGCLRNRSGSPSGADQP